MLWLKLQIDMNKRKDEMDYTSFLGLPGEVCVGDGDQVLIPFGEEKNCA